MFCEQNALAHYHISIIKSFYHENEIKHSISIQINNMTPASQPYTFDRVIRMLLTALTIAAIILLLKRLSDVLLPFFIALLIAYLLNPVVLYVQKSLKIKRRIWAVIITLTTLFGLMTGLIMWLSPIFVKEMIRMANLIGMYVQETDYNQVLPGSIEIYIRDFLKNHNVQDLFNPENVYTLLQRIGSSLWSVVSGSIQVLLALLGFAIVMLYLIFILVDFDKMEESWPLLIPARHRHLALEISNDLKDGMRTYFRAQGLIAFLVGVGFSIGFTIIGLPMAIIMGMFIGLLNLVPYLQLLGLIPAFMLALLKALDSGNSFWHEAFLVLLVTGIVQTIQDVILTPKIMGKAYGLNPALILLSLSIWGSLLGFIGLLLALPFTTIFISYYKRFVLKDTIILQEPLKTGEADYPES